MELNQHRYINQIMVSLKDVISIDKKQHIAAGTVDMVTASGTVSLKSGIVLGFKKRVSHNSYFEAVNFRYATPEEIHIFNLRNYEPYNIFEMSAYKVGDKLRALSDVTTVEGEYTVLAERVNQVEDIIINRKEIKKSIFWFKDHKGVFRMSDNFELID